MAQEPPPFNPDPTRLDEDDEHLPKVDPDKKCLYCNKAPIEYGYWPCMCPTMCKHCAMKMCTGGKCKVCHEMAPEVKRVFNQ